MNAVHCGASLSELQGALVFHRKSLGEKVRASNVHGGVCGGNSEECSVGMCSSWVHCTYCVGCL